jgi:hypothetical protein
MNHVDIAWGAESKPACSWYEPWWATKKFTRPSHRNCWLLTLHWLVAWAGGLLAAWVDGMHVMLRLVWRRLQTVTGTWRCYVASGLPC